MFLGEGRWIKNDHRLVVREMGYGVCGWIRWMRTRGRRKGSQLNQAFHFPPSIQAKRWHEVPLAAAEYRA